MCLEKIKKLSNMIIYIYIYIWFDTNFEIIREEYFYFLKRNKIVAELGRKKIKK